MKKAPWHFLQLLAALLLFGALPFGYLFDRPSAGWLLFAGIVLLHLAELKITLPLARAKHFPVRKALLKTMLFGFTWWVPWKAGLLQG